MPVEAVDVIIIFAFHIYIFVTTLDFLYLIFRWSDLVKNLPVVVIVSLPQKCRISMSNISFTPLKSGEKIMWSN